MSWNLIVASVLFFFYHNNHVLLVIRYLATGTIQNLPPLIKPKSMWDQGRIIVRVDVLMVVTISTVFWLVMLCGLERTWHSRGTYHSHLQDQDKSRSLYHLLLLVSCLTYFLMISSTKILVSLQTTWHYSPAATFSTAFIVVVSIGHVVRITFP